MYRYFRRLAGVGSGTYIYYWKSKGLSEERINSITASSDKVTTQLSYYGTKRRLECNERCLKNSKHLHCLWDK